MCINKSQWLFVRLGRKIAVRLFIWPLEMRMSWASSSSRSQLLSLISLALAENGEPHIKDFFEELLLRILQFEISKKVAFNKRDSYMILLERKRGSNFRPLKLEFFKTQPWVELDKNKLNRQINQMLTLRPYVARQTPKGLFFRLAAQIARQSVIAFFLTSRTNSLIDFFPASRKNSNCLNKKRQRSICIFSVVKLPSYTCTYISTT